MFSQLCMVLAGEKGGDRRKEKYKKEKKVIVGPNREHEIQ